VTQHLKGGIVAPEERNVAMQQIDKQVSMAMDTHATTEEKFETRFSMWSVAR
jgi:hypothetical protein